MNDIQNEKKIINKDFRENINEIKDLLKQHKKEISSVKKNLGKIYKIIDGKNDENSTLKDEILLNIDSIDLLNKKIELQLKKIEKK